MRGPLWTATDEEQLRKYYADGLSPLKISKITGRTAKAISAKAVRMGMQYEPAGKPVAHKVGVDYHEALPEYLWPRIELFLRILLMAKRKTQADSVSVSLWELRKAYQAYLEGVV